MNASQSIYVLKILHIIYHHLSIDGLIDLGLEYSQIAKLLSQVLQDGLVLDQGEQGLILTEKGIKLFEKLRKEIYPNNPSEWILPAEEYRIPKTDKYDIYLPKKKFFE